MNYYVGIDLGGTNIATGVVNEDCKIIGKASVKTNLPRPADAIADDMKKAVLLAVEDAKISMDEVSWIGIGTPGIANSSTGVVEYSCNLDFNNVPLQDMIQQRLGKPTFIENDANAAAYGEYVAGAAKGTKKALAITLGTGVGGGIIIDGKIYSGFNFAGAEMGHIVIEYNGRPCGCGRKGCLEAYGSATGLINITKDAMKENKDSLLWKECNGDISKVSGRTAFDAMRKGDATGKKVVDTYISYLACGLTSLLNIFQPEILVIGGGICKEGDTLLVPLRKQIMQEIYLGKNSPAPVLKIASLGNDAGIIGAAMLGRLHTKK